MAQNIDIAKVKISQETIPRHPQRRGPSAVLSRATDAAETVAQLSCEERRLLEGGEVAAFVELVPVDDVRVDRARPAARYSKNFLREDAEPHGKVDASLVHPELVGVFAIDPRRRGWRVGE